MNLKTQEELYLEGKQDVSASRAKGFPLDLKTDPRLTQGVDDALAALPTLRSTIQQYDEEALGGQQRVFSMCRYMSMVVHDETPSDDDCWRFRDALKRLIPLATGKLAGPVIVPLNPVGSHWSGLQLVAPLNASPRCAIVCFLHFPTRFDDAALDNVVGVKGVFGDEGQIGCCW